MSATTITISSTKRPGGPASMVAALPPDLSHSPLLGILGVVMGAGIVTLAGRLLSLGLADLKGSVGIGFDDGAWISSAFNAAIMFIGPFTVYLGALLGTRRTLLVSAAMFIVVSALLPLVHTYSLLIFLLVIAGLTSGTFYPLTLTFALRNIPLRYLAFTVALYATCVEGAVNFAPSLYGFYREHLSWEWMFWTSAVITPVMMACIYFGIPESPKPQNSRTAPSFIGFCYASAGFALVFAALDQGQRLDWWRSGVFTALFIGGAFLLICSLVRRLRSPNPLVDLPYLRKWNTNLLAVGLFVFRFVLLATILIIPQSLAVRGFDAAQIGPAILWTALPELLLAFLGAILLNRGFDTRLLMAIGQSFAFMGLVSSLILQAIFSGALEVPQRALTFSAFFHTVRLFGGQIGVAVMGRFIAEHEKLHSNLLGLQVQRGDWISEGTVRNLTAGLAAKSNGLAGAAGRALGIVDGKVRLQAYALTFIDAFHLVAWTCVGVLFVIAMLHRSPMNFRDLGSLQVSTSTEEATP